MAVTPRGFGKFTADEAEEGAKLVKFSGAKADWLGGDRSEREIIEE